MFKSDRPFWLMCFSDVFPGTSTYFNLLADQENHAQPFLRSSSEPNTTSLLWRITRWHGTQDGKFLSNTYAFEHGFDWSGILIEPLPEQVRVRPAEIMLAGDQRFFGNVGLQFSHLNLGGHTVCDWNDYRGYLAGLQTAG